MKTTMIDRSGLVALLENTEKHQFVSVETETNPKMNVNGRVSKLSIFDKFGCSPKSIVKVSSFTAMIGLTYKNVIENRLKKEGKDISSYETGTSWHEPVPGTKNLVRHKQSGEEYVYLFCVANNVPTSAFYNMESGKMIDKEELTEYLPKETAPKNQGLDEGNEVIVRTYKLGSIRKIKTEGEVYSVC